LPELHTREFDLIVDDASHDGVPTVKTVFTPAACSNASAFGI